MLDPAATMLLLHSAYLPESACHREALAVGNQCTLRSSSSDGQATLRWNGTMYLHIWDQNASIVLPTVYSLSVNRVLTDGGGKICCRQFFGKFYVWTCQSTHCQLQHYRITVHKLSLTMMLSRASYLKIGPKDCSRTSTIRATFVQLPEALHSMCKAFCIIIIYLGFWS